MLYQQVLPGDLTSTFVQYFNSATTQLNKGELSLVANPLNLAVSNNITLLEPQAGKKLYLPQGLKIYIKTRTASGGAITNASLSLGTDGGFTNLITGVAINPLAGGVTEISLNTEVVNLDNGLKLGNTAASGYSALTAWVMIKGFVI